MYYFLADLKSYRYIQKLQWHISFPIWVRKQDCPLSNFRCAESVKVKKTVKKWFICIKNCNSHTINLTTKEQREWEASG